MSFSYTTPPGHPGPGFYGFTTSSTPSPAASPTSPTGRAYTSASSRHPSRTHSRHTSYGGDSYGAAEPRPFSPRYTSGGYYATGAGPNVSRNKPSWSSSSPPRPETKRQYSHYSYRASYESDEDNEYQDFEYEYVEDRDGKIYLCRVPLRRPAHTTHKHGSHGTDKYYYQSQKYAEDPELSPYGSSARRQPSATSTPQRPATTRPAATRPMATPKSKPREAPPKATEEDARSHRIPPGYSLKNWDPTEEPIMLLGSVFDANSLGKWIYDWTVYHHGPATPLSEMAGELWLLLIQLAGKVKRAEECMSRIRKQEDREMVEDFILSGERLTDKLKALLKACEAPMLKAGRKGSSKTTAQLGKNAGTEFVDSIFGRDRQLDATEKFMASIRLWNMRFDANCEDILRRPGQYE